MLDNTRLVELVQKQRKLPLTEAEQQEFDWLQERNLLYVDPETRPFAFLPDFSYSKFSNGLTRRNLHNCEPVDLMFMHSGYLVMRVFIVQYRVDDYFRVCSGHGFSWRYLPDFCLLDYGAKPETDFVMIEQHESTQNEEVAGYGALYLFRYFPEIEDYRKLWRKAFDRPDSKWTYGLFDGRHNVSYPRILTYNCGKDLTSKKMIRLGEVERKRHEAVNIFKKHRVTESA